MKNKLKNLLRWTNLLLILLTLLAYLSPHINPVKFWHFSFLGLAYPILLLANLIFILFWIWRRNRYFLLSAVCILVGFDHFTGFVGLNNSTELKKDILVMTYNVAGLRRYFTQKNGRGKVRMNRLKEIIQQEGKPEILCVQESYQESVGKALQKIFDYQYFYKSQGTIIYSSFPISNRGKIPFGKTGNSCIWADLKTSHGLVRVYSAHLQSNWLVPAALKVAKEKDPRKKETWLGVAEVMRLYKRAAVQRAGQAEKVAEHIGKSPHPVVLCGDLNDTPVSYTYQVLSKNLQDSFRQKGFGFDFTFAGKIPGLRIDYVLADERFTVGNHKVPQLELSDHYPVLVTLDISK